MNFRVIIFCLFIYALSLISNQNIYATEMMDFIKCISGKSSICERMVQDVSRRDENSIEFNNVIIDYLQSFDSPHQGIIDDTLFDLTQLESQWGLIAVNAGTPVVDLVSSALASQKMCDNLKGDGAIIDYGIIPGARSILLNESVLTGIFYEHECMPQPYRYKFTELAVLGGDTLRGSSRSADLNCALFTSAFRATINRADLPTEEFNYFTFAEMMRVDVGCSQAIDRHIIPKSLSELIKSQHEQSQWFQFDGYEEDRVQLFNFHGGYAYGGRRNHIDQRNAFGPTDCSEWLALLFKPEIANTITTRELMMCADRQETGAKATVFDDFFKYVPVSQHEPLLSGDILCKTGHVVGYLGNLSGENITISASRNRGPVIGHGIDGIGIRVGDPLLNFPYKRFRIKSES